MNRFDPPGFVEDLTDPQKDEWSRKVSKWVDQAREGNPQENDGPRGQFFNALTTPPASDAQVKVISWNAFPRQVQSTSLSNKQRWRRADADRDVQDEYCEWSVTRDPASSKITRVTFTCEGPEYWDFLAEINPDKVLALYQQFVSASATRDDLFVNGRYQRRNRFNSGTSLGAMHLIQGANFLTAEIELGAAATIRRMRNGQAITDAQELIRCSGYGEARRNSDPHIGEQVNGLARGGADVTINNPVGLYFHEFNPVGLTTKDGTNPREFWTYVRGKAPYFVRAVYEVPPGRGYVVGDITDERTGKCIEFGAQIADFITIKLEGLATRIGQSTVKPFTGCRRETAPSDVAVAAAAVATGAGGTLRGRRTSDDSGVASAPGVAKTTGAARLPRVLRREPELVEAADATEMALLAYPKLSPDTLTPRLVAGKILAYASPDSTYAVTKKLLDSAQRSIVIGIYDFRADYMKESLKSAMRRGVTVALMLDTNKDDDPGLFGELTALGAHCVRAPSSSAGSTRPYFGNAHEKIIVIDHAIVMIQSGNWSENSIPFNEGDGVDVGHFQPGNRDMGIAVHSRELATFFAELVGRDMRLAEGQPVDVAPAAAADVVAVSGAAGIFFEAAPADVPTRLFPSLTVSPSAPVRITPVITPENFHEVAKEFLRSAKRSIRIEQQYIRGNQSAIVALLQEIDKARGQHPNLDIRIIVSPKYLTGSDRQHFLDAMKTFRLDFDDNYRFLTSRYFVHCHNKLIVVDDERVLLGSQNWSTTGVLSNREASLLVEHAGIAAYFAEMFDADWQVSEPTGAAADALLAEEAVVMQPSDFARGDVVISSVRDYMDV